MIEEIDYDEIRELSRKARQEYCHKCGKLVANPVYAPKHEETIEPAAYHKTCLDQLARDWERRNP